MEEKRADPFAALVNAALRQLDRAVSGEQIRKIVEQVLVEVVTVRAFEVLQRIEVLHAPDPVLGTRQD